MLSLFVVEFFVLSPCSSTYTHTHVRLCDCSKTEETFCKIEFFEFWSHLCAVCPVCSSPAIFFFVSISSSCFYFLFCLELPLRDLLFLFDVFALNWNDSNYYHSVNLVRVQQASIDWKKKRLIRHVQDSIAATANTILMDFPEIIKIVEIHLDNRKPKTASAKIFCQIREPDFLIHRIRFFQC